MRTRKHASRRVDALGAAERGRIVQSILVEGWTAAEVAAHFHIDERAVALWVEEFRRRGMASLRESDAKRFPLFCRLADAGRKAFASLRREPQRAPSAPVEIGSSVSKRRSERRNF